MTDLTALVLKLQESWAADDQPRATLEAAGKAFAAAVGWRLYTVTQSLSGGREVERLYSSDETAYPVGGRKPVLDNAYTAQVRGARQPFLAATPAGFAPLFPDHAKITAMGLGAVINLPVVWAGRTLGTINLLDREGAYGPEHLPAAMTIARQLIPVFLSRPA